MTTTALTSAASTVPPTTSAAGDAFRFIASEIDDGLRKRIEPTSWREGCPVPLENLRYVRLTYFDDAGKTNDGELIVNQSAVADIETVFESLFRAKFPIHSMRLVDDFGGDDIASVIANNTSAFNCRQVTGGSSWSNHAFGTAIDINPLVNPYVRDGEVIPPESAPYVDRSLQVDGRIDESGPVVAAFDGVGWDWGGRFESMKDWQHFSSDGG